MSEKLLTVAQAAEALSLNPQTVRVWLRSGKLRGLRTRGDGRGRDEWRIPESAITESLAAPQVPQVASQAVPNGTPLSGKM